MQGKSIKFHFHPYKYESKNHILEKSIGDNKHRYLCGVSSGLKEDAHGERMTEKCIKSFMAQAESGDVLLYPDIHGIKESEDIGIMTKATVLDNGDWYTEYRLYDETDEVGNNKLEKIKNIWKQVNGDPPYTKPKQKGFSIEGIIPDESIIKNNRDRNAIDDVLLDGVVLVPRPAYTDSVTTAVYKALNETTNERRKALQESIRGQLMDKEEQDKYYSKKWELNDSLERVIELIMLKKNTNKREELSIIFEEFKDMMIDLILSSENVFVSDKEPFVEDTTDILNMDEPRLDTLNTFREDALSAKVDLYKSLLNQIKILKTTMEATK